MPAAGPHRAAGDHARPATPPVAHGHVGARDVVEPLLRGDSGDRLRRALPGLAAGRGPGVRDEHGEDQKREEERTHVKVSNR
jgi:hypothetical protein